MGCTDRESNAQREVFRDGKWWATLGYTPSWEGPVDELTRRFPEYSEPRFLQGDNVFSAEQMDNGDNAIVRLIGKVTLLSN